MIAIDWSITSLVDHVKRISNTTTLGLISDISQINDHWVHMLTNYGHVLKVQKFMDKYLDGNNSKLDEETKKMIPNENTKSIRSGRDTSLPSIIMIYKKNWLAQLIINGINKK